MHRQPVAADTAFLLVTFGATGAISLVNIFKSPPDDGLRAGKARALIAGAERYQLFRIRQDNVEDLEFERVR